MARITISAPDPQWPQAYKQIEQQLQNVLESLAIQIDHIGSTSVPGLPAKNVIDIQVTVRDLSHPEITGKLSQAGYRYLPDIQSDNLVGEDENSDELKKLYFREKNGEREAHIHIRESGRLNQKYPLLFRDFLRHDSMVRQAYATVKQALAKRFPDDAESYYAIKDPYMDTIYRAACLWEQTRTRVY
ncbi:dephospho-CoA kinase/protein folding accessory domain-containing protein [Vibrio aerogenes CECT 7868]|uniref:Dephospho-CoA kinase/protein folding accessory domain-containing protein n=1 Tax=Vibrio aerogenes CECT 7868 TaxID=1216006 RepID=A0A1M5UTS5_9VIBR|nr:GrpB family protein [Vibrio aerogenes]SHH66326.1 dephospho-CoA kinase/protein folding accessory domain-containing protein [Vibrio aerogenes CECT 7868]